MTKLLLCSNTATSRLVYCRPMALSESVLFCWKTCTIGENNASTKSYCTPYQIGSVGPKADQKGDFVQLLCSMRSLLQQWECFSQPLNSDNIEKYD